jgi:hypothetical protein
MVRRLGGPALSFQSRAAGACSVDALNSNRLRSHLLVAIGSALIVASLSAQTLVVDTPTADAGAVQRGTIITKEFIVKNTGSAVLRITDVKPGCGCTLAKFDRTIPPGGQGKIVLTVDTKSFRTAISKTAVVLSNDPNTPELSLKVLANVKGLVKAEPSEYLNIHTTLGQRGVAEVRLVSDNAAFRPNSITTTEHLNATLSPGSEPGTWKLLVTSEATAPVGLLLGTVTVKTGIPEEPEFRIPVSGLVRPLGQAAGSAEASAKTPSDSALTNEEVLKLIAADLEDDIVVAKIKNAPVAHLDVTTDALVSLKEKKVNKIIVAAMIERAGQPNRTDTTAAAATSSAAAPSIPASPCAGVEMMGLYKNEIFDKTMGGGIVEWLAKIRNNTAVTKIVVFGWRDSEGQQRNSQAQIGGGAIVSVRVDMTQARFIAPVADLRLLTCE